MKKVVTLGIALLLLSSLSACGRNNNVSTNSHQQTGQSAPPSVSAQMPEKVDTGNSTTQKAECKKVKITIGETVLTATLNNNETAQDFITLLPLTLRMDDFGSNHKCGHLPRAISEAGTRQQTYANGDVAYWSQGPDLAMFYDQEGRTIDSGIFVIGKIDSGLEVLKNTKGSEKITIELMN